MYFNQYAARSSNALTSILCSSKHVFLDDWLRGGQYFLNSNHVETGVLNMGALDPWDGSRGYRETGALSPSSRAQNPHNGPWSPL